MFLQTVLATECDGFLLYHRFESKSFAMVTVLWTKSSHSLVKSQALIPPPGKYLDKQWFLPISLMWMTYGLRFEKVELGISVEICCQDLVRNGQRFIEIPMMLRRKFCHLTLLDASKMTLSYSVSDVPIGESVRVGQDRCTLGNTQPLIETR